MYISTAVTKHMALCAYYVFYTRGNWTRKASVRMSVQGNTYCFGNDLAHYNDIFSIPCEKCETKGYTYVASALPQHQLNRSNHRLEVRLDNGDNVKRLLGSPSGRGHAMTAKTSDKDARRRTDGAVADSETRMSVMIGAQRVTGSKGNTIITLYT